MKSFDEFKDQLSEKYQVVAKTKDGETFKSGVYDTKKKAYDMHWKLAKGNKHKSVETVKVDEEVELDEAVYSIKNTKTGQIYFHSKYPITKDNSRLKKIQAAGGDHIHATPHKDGKPMSEAYVAPALSAANFKAERDRQPNPESLKLDVKHVGGVSDAKAIKKHLASKGVHAQIGTSDGYKTVNMYNLSHKPAEFKRKLKEEINQGEPMSNMDQYVNAIGDKADFRGGLDEQQKAHTVPKSEKEKDLAKMAPPHDKITHADVMVGRGVKKEEVDLDEEELDELSINKMLTYRSKATEKLGSDPAKDVKRKEGIRVSGMKVKSMLKKEEVELDEAKDMMKVAGDIETYAKKSGGIDKADMMKVAGMIKRGDMKGAEKYTMSLDSDPRDFLLSKMGFNEAKEPPFDMPYKKAEPTTKTDKSGAVHTPMSRARDLARQAMKKQMKEQFDLDITDEQADSLVESINLEEKTLTPAEMKKREEIAQAMERKDPGMDMSKKMAIATATAKKVAEETEELDEISKATLGSYIKKAKGSAIGAAQVTGMGASMTGQKTQDKAERKVQKRAAGINKAVDRLTSEETDLEEGMISYTDFMDKIKMHRKAGNKIVDDKYSDKHATYTSVDSEGTAKKITHTPAGVKQQHLGSMKADDDQAAETKPAEKRSRGRPAGSKSGVSKYNK